MWFTDKSAIFGQQCDLRFTHCWAIDYIHEYECIDYIHAETYNQYIHIHVYNQYPYALLCGERGPRTTTVRRQVRQVRSINTLQCHQHGTIIHVFLSICTHLYIHIYMHMLWIYWLYTWIWIYWLYTCRNISKINELRDCCCWRRHLVSQTSTCFPPNPHPARTYTDNQKFCVFVPPLPPFDRKNIAVDVDGSVYICPQLCYDLKESCKCHELHRWRMEFVIFRLLLEFMTNSRSHLIVTNSMHHLNITNFRNHSHVTSSVKHPFVSNCTSLPNVTNSIIHLNITNSMSHPHVTSSVGFPSVTNSVNHKCHELK